MAPRDFFVRLGMLYKCSDFHSSRTMYMAGLVFKEFLLYGVAWKLAGLPRPNGLSNQKAFDNFSCPMSEDQSE